MNAPYPMGSFKALGVPATPSRSRPSGPAPTGLSGSAASITDARIDMLAASHSAKLDEAERLTDFPSTLIDIASYRAKIAGCVGYGRASALGYLGENGMAPAIDGILAAAKFHGKPWYRKEIA